jgi:hypothetical protein
MKKVETVENSLEAKHEENQACHFYKYRKLKLVPVSPPSIHP